MRTDTSSSAICTVDDRSVPERGHHELRVIFASTPTAVRDALRSTLSGLCSLRLSPDEVSTVELVLAEVMNNVVEHAFPGDCAGTIELHVEHSRAGLLCRVLDDGMAMPNGNPPDTAPPDPGRPPQLLAEGGFGWFLIRSLACDLVYCREAGLNRLSFRLPVARNLRTC